MIDSNHHRSPWLLTGRLLAPLLLSCVLHGATPLVACGAERFGDSSWVAPGMPAEDELPNDGPRVAPPDSERTWESVLRALFRLILLPFRIIGRGMELGVNSLATRYLEPESKPSSGGPKLSVRVDVNGATTGVDNIGIGPALKWDRFPTAESRIEASGALSLNDRRRARFQGWVRENRPLSYKLNVDYDFKPDREYYGIGNDTEEAGKAFYRLENTKVEAVAFLGALPFRRVQFRAGYSSISPGVGEHGTPLLGAVYPEGSVPYGSTATRYFIAGIAGDVALLNNLDTPSFGVHCRGELQHAAGLRSADPDYNQWLLEGRAYLPVFASRRVLAFRAAYAGVDPTSAGTTLPFYRLMQSEGQLRFLGFSNQRFRDQQLALAHAEYRWIISHKVSAIAIYQLGAVAPERSSFSIRTAHISWGGGLRLGLREAKAVRLDIATSDEGLHGQLTLKSDF